MSFPIVQAASTTVEETCHLATDVVQGTRYAGKMYKLGMQSAYKAQLTDSFIEQNELSANPNLTDEQRAEVSMA
jgi:hypothetical protein